MPCRPSPEEEAWAAAAALDALRQRAAEFDRQRALTLDLLMQVLAESRLGPAFVSTVLGSIATAPTTTVMPTGDEHTQAQRLQADAEISLCRTRAVLMQVIPLMPNAVVARHAERIAAERDAHLRHRREDGAAEVSALAHRLTELIGTSAEPAELARLRAEIDRVQAIAPERLLANREFTPGTVCPRCGQALPELPGLDATLLALIAARIGMGQTLAAIKLVHEATGLGLAPAKRFVDCPHGSGQPLPAVPPPPSARSPFRCRTCRNLLPPITGLSSEVAQRMLLDAVADRQSDLRSTLRQVTGWSEAEAKAYLYCPHRVPKQRS